MSCGRADFFLICYRDFAELPCFPGVTRWAGTVFELRFRIFCQIFLKMFVILFI